MKVFIPVICYNHTCHTAFMFSLMRLVLLLRDLNIEASLFPIGFDSLISRARNAAVAYFMSSSDYTHLLFLDSDIEFDTDDILKLFNSNEKLIGGAYAQKWLNVEKVKTVFNGSTPLPENPMKFCTNHSVHLTNPVVKNEKGFIEVDYLTTGCMLIQKSVITTLMEHHSDRKYKNDVDGYCGADQEMFYNLFSVEINSNTRQFESEDYSFCRLWKETGGKIYLIPEISLTHYGWYGYMTTVDSHCHKHSDTPDCFST